MGKVLKMIFAQQMRVGIQLVVEGDQEGAMQIKQLIALATLFLEIAIPALLAIQSVAVLLLAMAAGFQDAWQDVRAIRPPLWREFLLMKGVSILLFILVGVLIGELK